MPPATELGVALRVRSPLEVSETPPPTELGVVLRFMAAIGGPQMGAALKSPLLWGMVSF
jgi:hypothetical protein